MCKFRCDTIDVCSNANPNRTNDGRKKNYSKMISIGKAQSHKTKRLLKPGEITNSGRFVQETQYHWPYISEQTRIHVERAAYEKLILIHTIGYVESMVCHGMRSQPQQTASAQSQYRGTIAGNTQRTFINKNVKAQQNDIYPCPWHGQAWCGIKEYKREKEKQKDHSEFRTVSTLQASMPASI